MLKYNHLAGDDIYLENGYRLIDTEYGDVCEYEDEELLEFEIAKYLALRPGSYTGSQFRFLRRHLKLSQEELAVKLGREGQAIARAEKSKEPVSMAFEAMLRLMFLGKYFSDMPVGRLSNIVEGKERPSNARVVFSKTAAGWSYVFQSAYRTVNTTTGVGSSLLSQVVYACIEAPKLLFGFQLKDELVKEDVGYRPLSEKINWKTIGGE